MFSIDASGVSLLCLLTLIAGGGQFRAAEEPLRIGLIVSEGADADALAASARIATEEVNASGGIEGRPLQLVRAAAGHPWRGGSGAIARVVFDDHLVAVIGPGDGTTAHAVAQVATRRRIPVVTFSPEGSLTRAMDPWVLRGVPDDETQARAMLRWARGRGAGDRLLVAVPPGREGRERLDSLRRAASTTGCRVVRVMDGTAANLRAMNDDVDVLMLWLDTEPAIDLLAAWTPDRIPAHVLGSTRLDTVSFAGRLADGPGPDLKRLRSSLDARPHGLAIPLLRTGREVTSCAEAADTSLPARLGRDLVHALAGAALRAGAEPLDIRDALRDGSEFAGCSGTFGFDDRGNRTGDLPVGRWRGGQWVPEPLETVDLAARDDGYAQNPPGRTP